MTALPPELPQHLQERADISSAYTICLNIEHSLQKSAEEIPGSTNEGKIDAISHLVFIRVLGYLLLFWPKIEGVQANSTEIIAARNNGEIVDIGRYYFHHLIRAFRCNLPDVPPYPDGDSPSDSPRSFRHVDSRIKHALDKAPEPRSYASAKRDALIRDSFRCSLTGRHDLTSAIELSDPRQQFNTNSIPNALPTLTFASHIFNTKPVIQSSDLLLVWNALCQLGYPDVVDELLGDQIHRLENVMTIDGSAYSWFAHLRIWFEATDTPNSYILSNVCPLLLRGYSPEFTFTTPSSTQYPPPSPVYLSIHASCAKIAQYSGASEYIDQLSEDKEGWPHTTLDEEGTDPVLSRLLDEALYINFSEFGHGYDRVGRVEIAR